jgi:selenocysteine lyase/cysteine desulfurase
LSPALKSKFVRENGGSFFDSASLASVPKELVEKSFEPLAVEWDMIISEARHSVGKLLAPEKSVSYAFEPDDHVTLFTNTTSAFARVLSRIERAYAGSDPTLLTTDLEYPGCVAAIDDSWSGPVVMARIAKSLVWSTDPDGDLAEAMVRSNNFVKPRVVFVSHLMRTTGQVMTPKTLRNLRELNPRVIIVLDGSQAIGNVVVTRELLEQIDFYIASGHKWLGGLTTSGFVWLRDPDRWEVADPAQAFAYPGQLGGSGNSAAWSSLVASIADMTLERPKSRLEKIASHNRSLGRSFIKALEPLAGSIEIVTPRRGGRPPSGLVTIGVSPTIGEPLVETLEAQNFAFSRLDSETVHWRSGAENRFLLERDRRYPTIKRAGDHTPTSPKKDRIDLRFCFHYWHGEGDVRKLADAIAQSIGQ